MQRQRSAGRSYQSIKNRRNVAGIVGNTGPGNQRHRLISAAIIPSDGQSSRNAACAVKGEKGY